MNEILYAEKKRTSYENFVAQCPWCGQESIFNRASDLKDLRPIASRTVSCLNPACGKPFIINGDSVNSAPEMLVFDCYELLQLKHYMNCILTLAQAYEVLFNLFFRVELLYKPFATDPNKDIDRLNGLAQRLTKKVQNHTFGPMRALFLRQLVSGSAPRTLDESEVAIAALDDRPKDPRDIEFDSLSDTELAGILKALKATKINKLRNQVVHKRAYRPTREEAELALEETRLIIFPLTQRLGLCDDIYWYVALKEREGS